MDWDGILDAWIGQADDRAEFVDHVYFFIATRNSKLDRVRKAWGEACLRLALRDKNPSLLESLILGQQGSLKESSDLVRTAFELAPHSYRVRRALAIAGFLPSDEAFAYAVRKKKMQERALKNLPAAIRRKDIKALQALLRWEPDIRLSLQSGKSVLAMAERSPCAEVREIFHVASCAG